MAILAEHTNLVALLVYVVFTLNVLNSYGENLFGKALLYSSILFYTLQMQPFLLSTLILMIINISYKERYELTGRIVTIVRLLYLGAIAYSVNQAGIVPIEALFTFSIICLMLLFISSQHQLLAVLLFITSLSMGSVSIAIYVLIGAMLLVSCLIRIPRLKKMKAVMSFAIIAATFEFVEIRNSIFYSLCAGMLLVLFLSLFRNELKEAA
jgi:hypothetical protein